MNDFSDNTRDNKTPNKTKKRYAAFAIVIVVFTTTILVLTYDPSDSQDVTSMIKENVFIKATYHDAQNKVVITYNDLTGAHTPVSVEMLGLAESYRKTFEGPQFETDIGFTSPPKYGWVYTSNCR